MAVMLADAMIYVSWGLLCFFIILAIILYIFIKRKVNKQVTKKINIKNVDGSSLSLNVPYLHKKEVFFFENLLAVLPKDYVAFPRVGVDKLVKPFGSLVLYNQIHSKYVDVAVFLKKNMQPVAVIDLVDTSIGDSFLETQEPVVTKVLNSVQIPVLQIIVKSEYDKGELLEKFLDALDPVAITEMKRKKN